MAREFEERADKPLIETTNTDTIELLDEEDLTTDTGPGVRLTPTTVTIDGEEVSVLEITSPSSSTSEQIGSWFLIYSAFAVLVFVLATIIYYISTWARSG